MQYSKLYSLPTVQWLKNHTWRCSQRTLRGSTSCQESAKKITRLMLSSQLFAKPLPVPHPSLLIKSELPRWPIMEVQFQSQHFGLPIQVHNLHSYKRTVLQILPTIHLPPSLQTSALHAPTSLKHIRTVGKERRAWGLQTIPVCNDCIVESKLWVMLEA